ncbi:DNA repair protein RecN [Aliidiomarina sanyensis]|uniref:DNA repair protein RecN n=1 Tax=Aliidiomarina sanyensis TaxID=1249555 RepID=A0A432WDP2_9GAMM|nr:DNA repair protein RecN [Aliidiomarina sanyensis]RUO30532.1 DNA repair protein RecN [Aliidiomarina sanyensis]
MLTQLDIRQFAIVDHLIIDFKSGMTAITGETGAGKSIALDALSLCLGARAESGMVRPGASKAEVIASFRVQQLPDVMAWLESRDLALDDAESDEDNCIVRRTLSAEGRSKAFINGILVPVNLLKELGNMLVSLHGQHDHHLLMKPEYQLTLLDQYAGHSDALEKTRVAYSTWRQLKREQKELQSRVAQENARRQLLEYQVTELDEFAPLEGEYQQLDDEYRRLANASTLLEDAQFSLGSLYDSEHNNAYSLIQSVKQRLEDSVSLDAHLQPIVELLESASVQVEEAVHELRHYQDSVELDPAQLAETEKRLHAMMQLAKKHQVDPDKLTEVHQALKAELDGITQSENRLESLTPDIQKAWDVFLSAADTLSQSRRASAKSLAQAVTESLHALNIPDGEFEVRIETHAEQHQSASGIDHIQFVVSANAGQPLQPINKVASGGELSRISLAIQVLTAGQGNLPTLIFDEVDVGVSGPTAATVGKLLRSLGKHNQVLCVTHLPQVAARAHQQMFVRKQKQNGQTITSMEALSESHRIEELARLLGGDTITEHTLANARELLAG